MGQVKDKWTYTVDNEFALGLSRRIKQSETPPQQPTFSPLCAPCSNIQAFDQLVSLSGLRETAESCGLCRLLCQSLERSGVSDREEINILRDGSMLRKGREGPPILIIRADPGLWTFYLTHICRTT
jgi:hypothetical protein